MNYFVNIIFNFSYFLHSMFTELKTSYGYNNSFLSNLRFFNLISFGEIIQNQTRSYLNNFFPFSSIFHSGYSNYFFILVNSYFFVFQFIFKYFFNDYISFFEYFYNISIISLVLFDLIFLKRRFVVFFFEIFIKKIILKYILYLLEILALKMIFDINELYVYYNKIIYNTDRVHVNLSNDSENHSNNSSADWSLLKKNFHLISDFDQIFDCGSETKENSHSVRSGIILKY